MIINNKDFEDDRKRRFAGYLGFFYLDLCEF